VLGRQLQYLHGLGFDVTYIASRGRIWDEVSRQHLAELTGYIRTVELPMAREISPLRDLVSLWRLCLTMRLLRPLITNVGTPKAGLLGGLAAWLNRIPNRYYTLHGLRFETLTGWRRQLLMLSERLACSLAHRIICVSQSVREQAIAFGLTSSDRTIVLASGSCDGIDNMQFAPSPEIRSQAVEVRQRLGIPEHAPVIGFVGRLTRDKGIPELVTAFSQLSQQFPDLRLLLVGRFEQEDPLPLKTKQFLEAHQHVIFQDVVEKVAPYYAVMDLLVLPSHREGFPTVLLEAQAAGKPIVAAQSTGCIDAVLDGQNGFLFPIGDADALAKVSARILADKRLAAELGAYGQQRVKREYPCERIRAALAAEYFRRLLETTHVASACDLACSSPIRGHGAELQ
jgi:glycosyltransferase involved in cell wall biosynthesis